MKRSQILKKFHANLAKIKELTEANKELNRQHLLFSDKNQWYKESEEIVGRGKNKETVFRGRVYWKERFTDEDDPKQTFFVERSHVVRENNEWVEGL